MYTEEDVRRLFALRGEIEMELGVCRAQHLNRPEEVPPQMQQRINKLEQNLMVIDSLLSVLSENEAFVIKRHVLAQIDWPQIVKEYTNIWGREAEKSIRSFQICQTKALAKIARAINKRLDFSWIDIH